MKVDTTERQNGYVQLYGYRLKSVTVPGLRCGLDCTPALSVTVAPLSGRYI